MKQSLFYSLLHGHDKCTGTTGPRNLSVALLIMALGGSLIGVMNTIVEDPVCVPGGKKLRYQMWSLLIRTVILCLQFFIWRNYVERCNGLVGFILTAVLSALLLYFPSAYRLALIDEHCVSKFHPVIQMLM